MRVLIYMFLLRGEDNIAQNLCKQPYKSNITNDTILCIYLDPDYSYALRDAKEIFPGFHPRKYSAIIFSVLKTSFAPSLVCNFYTSMVAVVFRLHHEAELEWNIAKQKSLKDTAVVCGNSIEKRISFSGARYHKSK